MAEDQGKKPAANPAAGGPPSKATAKPVAAAKPTVAKPTATKPVAARPVTAKPVAAKSLAVGQPAVAKPVAAKPAVAKPAAAQALPTARPAGTAVSGKAVSGKAVAAKPVAQAVGTNGVAAKLTARPATPQRDAEDDRPFADREIGERPTVVTVLGALNMVLGLIVACYSALMLLSPETLADVAPMLAGPKAAGFAATWLQLSSGLGILSGIALFVSGIGLIQLAPWSRYLAVGWAIYQVIESLITKTIEITLVLNPAASDAGIDPTVVSITFLMLVAVVVYPLVLVALLMKRNVVAAFLGVSEEELGDGPSNLREWLRTTPGWMTSMVLHAVVLLMLGLLTLPEKIKESIPDLTALASETPSDVEEIQPEAEPQPEVEVEQFEPVDSVDSSSSENVGVDINDAMDDPAPAPNIETSDISPISIETSDLTSSVTGTGQKNGLGGRTGSARQALVAGGGGSVQSEEAVARGLKWLASHQNPDGSWNFEHNKAACQGRCGNNGKIANGLNGATAIALLPFLGAGETHREGKYSKVVQAGLAYLVNNMKVDQATGGNLMDGGTMYSHGLASICLCEAYAMTQDKNLFNPAQQAVNFITYAQDKVGGGWRYTPGQPGDTSVVGWQLMALKSAHMGYLQVQDNVLIGASNFLNTVQTDSGSAYGYTGPGNGSATTAIGLLCRMYMGWKKDEPALERGIQRLSQMGPSKNNMYYNYYATQVMHHVGGEEWKKWNGVMRDFLVNSQERGAHLDGSWFFSDGHSSESGGRLYVTAMCTMTLEVYYRHLPLYSETAAGEEGGEGSGEFGGEEEMTDEGEEATEEAEEPAEDEAAGEEAAEDGGDGA